MRIPIVLLILLGLFLSTADDASAAKRRRKKHRPTAKASPATGPFSDVPAGHWTYGAVQRGCESGILSCCGWSGRSRFNKIVNRYQMAVVSVRMLDRVGVLLANGRIITDQDVAMLEALSIEFAPEFKLLNVKPHLVEEQLQKLRRALALQRPAHPSPVIARLGEHARRGSAPPLPVPATRPTPSTPSPSPALPLSAPVGAANLNPPKSQSKTTWPLAVTTLLALAMTCAASRAVRPRKLFLAPLS